jgi:DNA-binding MarR family transcriptional regulator
MVREVIPYTSGDYKKYVYAQGKHYIRRIQEIIEVLDGAHRLHAEDTEDLWCMLDNAVGHLYRAAFVDDHRQADAEAHPATALAPDEDWAHKPVDLYDDGRTVATTVRFGDGEDDYATHVWHPDPGHPDNQAGAVIEFSRGPYPFRFGLLKVTAPGAIRVLYDDERNIPEDPDLTESQSRILEALREREQKGMVPSHTDAKHLAQQLAMTEQQIIEDEDVLEALGLIWSKLTVDQKRLLYALPNKDEVDPSDPSTYPSDAQLAKQLGMSMEEVKHHMRALERLGWVSGPSQASAKRPLDEPAR